MAGGQESDDVLVAEIISHAPTARRMRLEVPRLRGRRDLARKIELAARRQVGIEEARADAFTGRVLLRYAAEAPELGQLQFLKGPHLRDRTDEAGEPAPARLPLPPADPSAPHWHALEVEAVLARLETRR